MDSNLKFRSMNLPDIFIDQDTPENMYKIANSSMSADAKDMLLPQHERNKITPSRHGTLNNNTGTAHQGE